MSRPTPVSLCILLLAALACGDSTKPTPEPSHPGHVYVARPGFLRRMLVFPLPLSDASVPAESIGSDTAFHPLGIAVNTSGDVAVCPYSGRIRVYHPPITSTSTPSDSFDLADGSCALIAYGPDGRLYVANQRNYILAFTPPINASSVPDTLATSAQDALGVAFDGTNRMYVAQGTRVVQIYDSPYTGAPAVTMDTLPQPFFGLAVDQAGRLLVALGNDNKILIFNAPLSHTSPKADSLVTGLTSPFGIVIGADGRLFVANGPTIVAYDPPFTHSSAPAATITSAGILGAQGIAVGK